MESHSFRIARAASFSPAGNKFGPNARTDRSDGPSSEWTEPTGNRPCLPNTSTRGEEIFYFGQGGDLNAVRWNDWKVSFAVENGSRP